MVVCTIGFSKKSLREFIAKLRDDGVEKVIDVRLNNTSQLAGYAKKEDLEYILELVGIGYEHRPEFAPTETLFKEYKNKKIPWDEFQVLFNRLLEERKPLENFDLAKQPEVICLLCAEDKAVHCHRRLVAEYMQKHVGGLEIKHL
jgi:uncharacterized protein (DUF488 family)